MARRQEGFLTDQQYDNWVRTLVPYIYDAWVPFVTEWPGLTCRWGPEINKNARKGEKSQGIIYSKHTLYTSEAISQDEMGKGNSPKIVVATCDVPKAYLSKTDSCLGFHGTSRARHFRVEKHIHHPGPVNRIRECPQHPHIIATSTDAPHCLLWNVNSQPDARGGARSKVQWLGTAQVGEPDLKLVGHEANAPFAMAWSSTREVVASGAEDGTVLTWDLHDKIASVRARESLGQSLSPTYVLRGHSAEVGDVCFAPDTHHKLASAGADKTVLIWDTRAGTAPSCAFQSAHSFDIHALSWSSLEPHYIASGCEGGICKVWDLRTMQMVCEMHTEHRGAINRVDFHPACPGVLAAADARGVISVWKDKSSKAQGAKDGWRQVFQHLGHKSEVTDFQWLASDRFRDPKDPEAEWAHWTVLSVSARSPTDGGGSVQVWRASDFVHSEKATEWMCQFYPALSQSGLADAGAGGDAAGNERENAQRSGARRERSAATTAQPSEPMDL
ncbi:unnamed protein product [Pedinophyceae sp. YPF-701]|nr:unnamed protein product [Pedinophyceae sp. YPF-701]